MMQIVSEEDSRRWKEEVKHLHHSTSLEDRVVAILMDLEVGGSGNSGEPARAKAAAICKLFEQHSSAASVKVSLELAEEIRRSVMADLTDGCGTCHWASEYITERVKELDRMRAKGIERVDQKALVDSWKDVPEGTDVIVTLDRFDKEGPGDKKTKTRSAPWLLGGHTAVILLEGISGGYSLERVRKA